MNGKLLRQVLDKMLKGEVAGECECGGGGGLHLVHCRNNTNNWSGQWWKDECHKKKFSICFLKNLTISENNDVSKEL